MLFPTISFGVFFAVVLPVSWLLMPLRTWWKVFLTAASWFFYGCAGWGFVPLLAVSTVFNHFFAYVIYRTEGRARRWWVGVAVAANLASLGWFKYIGFLTTSSNSILDSVDPSLHFSVPSVLLPAGISFFTFQAITYVVDVHHRKIKPVGLLDFAVYLSFFPHLLAGPIVRASEFLPQTRHPIDPRHVDAGQAFWLIIRGLFKKVVIASYLATKAVNPLFGVPKQHAGLEALFGVYAYAIQIYADFSGYTDIAIGLALLLGVRFPQNFNSPYRSLSLQEFWTRWHMTLSRFLRDYLYIPLGGNRRGPARTYANLMVTMLLGGLWHGASWTFVAWGGLHGTGLVVERARLWSRSKKRFFRAARASPAVARVLPSAVAARVPTGTGEIPTTADADTAQTPVIVSDATVTRGGVAVADRTTVVDPEAVVAEVPEMPGLRWWRRRGTRIAAWLITFNFVCLAWIFFRATSFANAWAVLGQIFSTGPHVHLDVLVVAVVLVSLAVQWLPPNWSRSMQRAFGRWSITAQALVLAGSIVIIDAFGPPIVAPFIYFRF